MKPGRRATLAFLLVAAALAVWLRLPLLRAPFFLDDLVQMGYLAEGDSQSYSFANALDLYRFFDADTDAEAKMSSGDLPWRFDADQRCAFLRPVSSALMWLDHALFGLRSGPAHAHSLAWFVLYLVVLYALYRRILPAGGAAEVATLAAVLSPAGLLMVMWWSAREALLAALFTAATVLFHHLWCRGGKARYLLLSLVAFALALLSAESGVQALAFVFAYTVIQHRGGVRESFRRLLPIGVAFLVYLGAWTVLGYGVEGNALYVNPLGEPVAYTVNAVSKLHLAIGSAVLGQGSGVLVGLAVLVVAAALAWRQAGQKRGPVATALAWLALASLLSLIPSFGGRNAIRPWTLVIPQIGFHAILGLLIAAPWSRASSVSEGGGAPALWLSRAGAAFLFVACLILPARELRTPAAERRRASDSPEAMARQFPEEVREAFTPELRTLILVRAPIAVMPVGRLALWHRVGGFDREALSTIVLSDTGRIPLDETRMVVTRTGPSRLRVEADAPLVRGNDFFRFDSRKPLAAGQTIALGEASVTIHEVDAGRPTSIEVDFARPLDGPQTLLVTWSGDRYTLVEPPEVGGQLALR